MIHPGAQGASDTLPDPSCLIPMGLVPLPPHFLLSFAPEYLHSLHTLFCHSSIFPHTSETAGGRWWTLIFTSEAALVTLFQSCARGGQPANRLPRLWKEIKPTGLAPVAGAGSALGCTRNSDWGRWVGSWLVGSYKSETGKYGGWMLQLGWRVRPRGASPASGPVGREPSRPVLIHVGVKSEVLGLADSRVHPDSQSSSDRREVHPLRGP